MPWGKPGASWKTPGSGAELGTEKGLAQGQHRWVLSQLEKAAGKKGRAPGTGGHEEPSPAWGWRWPGRMGPAPAGKGLPWAFRARSITRFPPCCRKVFFFSGHPQISENLLKKKKNTLPPEASPAQGTRGCARPSHGAAKPAASLPAPGTPPWHRERGMLWGQDPPACPRAGQGVKGPLALEDLERLSHLGAGRTAGDTRSASGVPIGNRAVPGTGLQTAAPRAGAN